MAIGLLSGCLSRPSLSKQDFAFSLAPANVPATTNGPVLGIHRVNIAAPFASQSFVYRTGEYAYERDPYAEFLVPPEDGMAAALRTAFLQTGHFANVTEPGSALRADTLVEFYVDDLYGDFRDKNQPAAVLVARVIFYRAQRGLPGKVLLQKEYSQRIRLHARTAAALMAGWNQALRQSVHSAAADFAAHTKEEKAPSS